MAPAPMYNRLIDLLLLASALLLLAVPLAESKLRASRAAATRFIDYGASNDERASRDEQRGLFRSWSRQDLIDLLANGDRTGAFFASDRPTGSVRRLTNVDRFVCP